MLLLSAVNTSVINIDFFWQVAAIVIPLFGIYVSNKSIKRQLENDLMMRKQDVSIDKMTGIVYELIWIFDYMSELEEDELRKKLLNVLQTVFSYGSKKAILLAADLQQSSYHGEHYKDKYKVMARYALLATTIKEDVTGVKISPDYWFKLKLTDYEAHKNLIQKAINDLEKEYDNL